MRPSPQRSDPCDELGKSKGFDQVVVAASVEAGDPVLDTAHCRQKQNRGLAAGCAQALDQVQPVQTGYHPIDDEQIEPIAQCTNEAISTTCHLRD
jgi:hypothetical protein